MISLREFHPDGVSPGNPSAVANQRLRKLGFAAAAICAGVLFAIQGRINGALGAAVGNGFIAADISFCGSLATASLLLPAVPSLRAGLRRVRRALGTGELRVWHCLGGIGGAMFVVSQSITVGLLGVALFTVGVVAGQTVSGLLVDKAGLGPSGPQPLTLARIAGAALTLTGVATALAGGIHARGGLVLVILPLVGGAALAVQQAVIGRVAQTAGSPMAAGMVNFVVGTVVLAVAAAVSMVAVYGLPQAMPANPLLYLGGPIGAVFICAAAYLVAPLGVLVMALCAIAGQLIGSVLLDLTIPARGDHLEVATVVGAGVTLVAVAIASLPSRRSESAKMTR